LKHRRINGAKKPPHACPIGVPELAARRISDCSRGQMIRGNRQDASAPPM